jgi:SnoaL-like domain
VERAQVSRNAELQALLDKQAISEVIARYSRTLDWLDDAGQARCYWPDAAIDYGFFKGSAADFVPAVMQIERSSQRRWHFLGGLQIALHSATAASTECYGLATGVRNAEGVWTGNIYGGRYLDEFEKRGEEWRISRRQYVMDWSMPLGTQNDGTPNPAFPLPILEIVASGHPLYRAM